MPLTVGKSAGRKKIPQVQLNSDFWTSCAEVEWSFECIWEQDRTKTSGTANRQTECTGCPQGSPKGFPCPYFTTKGREFTYQSSFFIKKSNLRKERGKNYEFLHNSGNRIKDSRNSNRCRCGSMGRDQLARRIWE